MKHTPGPWAIHQFKDGITTEITEPSGTAVGYLEQVKFRDKAEREANSILIGAAPQLAAMLERIISKSYKATNLPDAHIHPDIIAEARSLVASLASPKEAR